MPMLPEAGKSGDASLRQACLALVQELAEPLTAIGSYLDAASRLHDADSQSERIKLGEALEKMQTQVARADAILRQLRDLLRHGKAAADG